MSAWGFCLRTLAVPVCVFALTGEARAQAPLSLDVVIHLAVTRNERARIADLQIDVTEAAVDKARAGFLPVVTLGATDVQRPYSRPTTPSNSANTSLTVTQPLLNVPAWPLYRQAQRLHDAQLLQSAQDKRLIGFDAARAFFQALSQEQVLKAGERRAEVSQANLENAQGRVDAQLNSSNDVTRAELELASAEREIALSKGSVQKAYINLSFLLNARVEGALVPNDETLKASEQQPPSVQALVALAIPKRLDVAATRHRVRAAHLFAQEPALRFAPVLGLTGLFRVASDTQASGRLDDESLTVTLTWTLYDAGVRGADRRSREAAAEIAELDFLVLKRGVENDVRLALANLGSAQAAFRLAVRAVTAARKSASETTVLYRQGLAKALELTNASASLFEAEISQVSAQFSMAQAYLDLRQAMGLDPLGTEIK